MRLNNREDLTPICATENVPLFVMYIKGELPEKNKSKLESHISYCSDCKINLAYVEEILRVKHPLSLDEKTLLLKYLTDPLFYYFISDIRKKVLSDVRDIVKEANINLKSDNIEKPKDEKPKQSSKLAYQKRPYSYTLMTAVIAAFVSLSSLIVLGLGIKYPALQSYLPFSKQDSTALDANSPNNLSSDLSIDLSKASETNRYQQLDTAIDDFLATQDRQYLTKAEFIAKDIQLSYEDNYGVDLVAYYKFLPSSAINKLKVLREKMFFLINQPNGDNYQQRLDDSINLEKQLISFGNLIDTYRIKLLLAKVYAKTYKYENSTEIITKGINFASNNKYLYLEGYFLLWKAKNSSLTANFTETEEAFKRVIEIGKKTNIKDLVINPSMTLAGLYQMRDEDKKSLEIVQLVLSNPIYSTSNLELAVGLRQMGGLSAFKLGFPELANSYLTDAIELSEKSKINYLIATSYTFLGLVYAEEKEFTLSENSFSKAQIAISQINEEATRLDVLSILLGYQAKAKLLSNEFSQAAKFYQESLEIIGKLGIEHNLENAQLNEGLAIALDNLGLPNEAKKYFASASHYKELAVSKDEKLNCLLSYVPNQCK